MNITELEDCIMCHGTDIYHFCLQLTKNKEEAEDLYQDTFLMVMKKLTSLEKEQNPKSYLLSICINLWKNKKRKYAWRQRIAGVEPLSEGKDYHQITIHPEDEILQKEQKEMVQHAIKKLNDKYRIPVYLYYMEELQLEEIAKILNIPKGTVKSRLFKARKLLKERLENNYEAE